MTKYAVYFPQWQAYKVDKGFTLSHSMQIEMAHLYSSPGNANKAKVGIRRHCQRLREESPVMITRTVEVIYNDLGDTDAV